jgi:hypothetical protein
MSVPNRHSQFAVALLIANCGGWLVFLAISSKHAPRIPQVRASVQQITGPAQNVGRLPQRESDAAASDSDDDEIPIPRPNSEAVSVGSSRVGRRPFGFVVDPKTPLDELLPAPPRASKQDQPLMSEDLARVPEIEFQAPLEKKLSSEELREQTALQIAKINHLNQNGADGFLVALRSKRPDLAGLPFAMGDTCRRKDDTRNIFAEEVSAIRMCFDPRIEFTVASTSTPVAATAPVSNETF